jgi:hypothetical protein
VPRANQAKVAKGAPVHRRHIVQWQKWTALGEVPQVHRTAPQRHPPSSMS